MDSHADTEERCLEFHVENLQRPNIYNQYLPYYQHIIQQASKAFNEIRERLSRSIQLGEFQTSFKVESYKLRQFISLYGYFFTKFDHIQLIQLYLSILSIAGLSCSNALICFDMLIELLQYVIICLLIYLKTEIDPFLKFITKLCRKPRLINRNELTIDWRILYRWAEFSINPHDSVYGLVTLPK